MIFNARMKNETRKNDIINEMYFSMVDAGK